MSTGGQRSNVKGQRGGRIVLFAFAIVVIVLFLTMWNEDRHRPTVRLVDGTVVSVEIADDAEERRVGLSEHIFLDSDRGMLFLFDEPSRPAFWMKDMDFPIDVVWLRDGTVVGIESDVPVVTDGTERTYKPAVEINQVLEVNAGFAAKHGLKTGQTLDIKLP